MEYKNWSLFYKEILLDFGYSEERDRESAAMLDKFLNNMDAKKTYQHLKKLLQNKDVFVCGAGPSIVEKIKKYKSKLNEGIIIAADGATSALLGEGLTPEVIVTDLDGYIPDQIEANKNGSVAVVHAHGDNIEEIKKWIGKFSDSILGTTQSDASSFKNLFNFGGFTDGDRAVFLAEHFGAIRVYLIGFDFNGEIGRFSFPEKKDINKKRKKLIWCGRLLEEVNQCKVVFL